DGALTACAPRAGLPVSRFTALLGLGGMREVCVARKNGRAGGRFLHTWCLAAGRGALRADEAVRWNRFFFA
ncbi:hypothetical protein, partial [Achromobacter insuavis]|uniref:hypothetical protein n=1 Tax=Achromobacter insuavis TaxID=1287735 RepID=UPI001F12EC06